MHSHRESAHHARHIQASHHHGEYPILFGAVQHQPYEPHPVEQFEPHHGAFVRRIVRAIRHRLRRDTT